MRYLFESVLAKVLISNRINDSYYASKAERIHSPLKFNNYTAVTKYVGIIYAMALILITL